jgi:two-component system LytT family response regulator
MQLTCVAIDDEPLALSLLQKYASRFPELKMVETFSDAIAGSAYLRQHTVDLLFIDINMPDITGIDLVRSLETKPMVVFTTAYRNFALDGFELDALDYLLKPISPERFGKAVRKALDYYQLKTTVNKPTPDALFVRSEYQLVRIELDSIEYIESVEDYIKIHLTEGRPVMTLMTMKAVQEKLPADAFQRIHRSYIVPVARIRSVLNKKVRLGSVELPVGESYSSFIRNWMKN